MIKYIIGLLLKHPHTVHNAFTIDLIQRCMFSFSLQVADTVHRIYGGPAASQTHKYQANTLIHVLWLYDQMQKYFSISATLLVNV